MKDGLGIPIRSNVCRQLFVVGNKAAFFHVTLVKNVGTRIVL